MKVTYDVTIRITIDVAAYAAEWDCEGASPDDVRRYIRNDLHASRLNAGRVLDETGTQSVDNVVCVEL